MDMVAALPPLEESMRNYLIAAIWTLTACTSTAESRTATEELAGPGGMTVTVRDVGQLAVSWSADHEASSYQVFQSESGGALAFAASVFDSGGGPPPTSYIADGLTNGVRYCYAIEATYADGSTSGVGTPTCALADGPPPHHISRERTLVIPPHLARVASGTPSVALSNISFNSAAVSALLYDIPCEVGDTVKRFTIDLAGDGVVDATVQFVKYTAATNDQQIITTTPLADIPLRAEAGFGFTTYTVDPPDQTVGPDEFLLIAVSGSGGSGVVNLFYGAARVTFTRRGHGLL